MSFPILKLVFASFRIMSRPINGLIIQSLKNRGQDNVFRKGFISVGHFTNTLEFRMNQFVMRVESESSDRATKLSAGGDSFKSSGEGTDQSNTGESKQAADRPS